MPLPADFARHMVDWQRQHGRQSLPWQNTQDPYRVWLSEIMLQQTTVKAVIPYYLKFLARWPTVAALAAAELDEERRLCYVGMTRDFFPRMHQLGPDGFAWVGCNGRAVGLAVATPAGVGLAAIVGGTVATQSSP